MRIEITLNEKTIAILKKESDRLGISVKEIIQEIVHDVTTIIAISAQ